MSSVSYTLTNATSGVTYSNDNIPIGTALVDSNGHGTCNLTVVVPQSVVDFYNMRSSSEWIHVSIIKNGDLTNALTTPQEASTYDQGSGYFINNTSHPAYMYSHATYNDTDASLTLVFNNFVFNDNSDITELSLVHLNDANHIYGTATFSSIHITPMYIGPVQVAGNQIDFSATKLLNAKAPTADAELVPKKYVDTYIQNTASYFQNLIDSVNNTDDLSDRIKALELQINRIYQALYHVDRDTSAIVVSDGNGGLNTLSYSYTDDVEPSTQHETSTSLPAAPTITF